MMEHFLAPQADILTLGCGGGNLATMLARSGKSVIVVDHNAASIDIARQFFGMPQDIPCIVEDFRTFLASCNRQFGGIAIDVGGPGFCFEEQFDEETCRHIARALAPGGRAIMNVLVGNDLDGATDVIASLLSGEGRDRLGFRSTWLDQPERAHCLPAAKSERSGSAAYCRTLRRGCLLGAEKAAYSSTT
jgi:SAM-dependent methyltransferase